MRILVQGPGAIGLMLATRLVESGIRTQLLDHDADRARRLNQRAIVVESPESFEAAEPARPKRGEELVRMEVLSPRSPAEPFDLLIVCVKNHDLVRALDQGVRFLDSSGRVLVLVNGLGQREALASVWPPARSWVGTVTYGSLLREEGRIRPSGGGTIRIGSLAGSEDSAAADDILACLRGAGFDVDAVADIERVVWEKTIINCGINPVAALLGVTNGELAEAEAFETSVRLARETAEVAAHDLRRETKRSSAELERWQGQDWRARLVEVCRATAGNRCSMLRDLETGRRTEIDALNGRVVELADRLGVAAPVSLSVTELIRTREARSKAAVSRRSGERTPGGSGDASG